MKEQLKILLLGRGGRESALASKLLESPRVETLYMAPQASGNAVRLDVDPMDFDTLKEKVKELGIDMVVVGSEVPIVAGIYDALEDTGVKIIAPSGECARLEGSKEFAKEFMSQHGIPTARFMTVTNDTLEEGLNFLESLKSPYVLKADGLASGKGVLILDSLADAKDTLTDMLHGMFGPSSDTVVIEEFLRGRECSVIMAVDGEEHLLLPVAKDYKRLLNGGAGPNTAGMGAVSPVPFVDADFMEKVEKRIIGPTLRGLKEEGLDYRGFLFLGLMELDGEPILVEYNVRLGDPETQASFLRIESDIVDILEGIADRTLALKKIKESSRYAAAVVIAGEGYPGATKSGAEIYGIPDARAMGCQVFDGEVRIDADGRRFADGGRVLSVCALGDTLDDACVKAQVGASRIRFDGAYFRDDIGRLNC